MFRLEKNQINIILALILTSGALIFLAFGIKSIPDMDLRTDMPVMENFSSGWVLSYETSDEKKIAESQNENNKTMMVTEIMSFPQNIPVNAGKTLTMLQRLPEYGQDDIYVVFHTNAEAIQVFVNDDYIYHSSRKDNNIKSVHVIKIDKEYREQMLTVKLTGDKIEGIYVEKIEVGNFANLIYAAFKNNGVMLMSGGFIILICAVLFVVWFMFKNAERQKNLMLYGLLEGLLIGTLFILKTDIFRMLTNMNYALYLILVCVIILEMVAHVTVVHNGIYKKKILFVTSIGILAYGVIFISVLVFQAFSLITIINAYTAVEVCSIIGVIACIAVLAVGIYKYGRREAFPFLVANGILLLGPVLQMIDSVLRHEKFGCMYIIVCTSIYLAIILICGLKRMFTIPKKIKNDEITEEDLRAELLEQLNPNLLFASFHTLQNLIKNGSANSTKMIYYISVYIRDNLRAFENAGEIVPFESELEHIIAYLQLQKIRNRNFNFSVECKETIFNIPRYCLEPMVENAVKYGIAGNGNQGNVVIRTYKRAEGYAIQIIDDGIGFNTKILKRESPTALLNLFDRLEDMCDAQVEIISKEGKGTVITVILPMLENDIMEEYIEEDE